MCGPRSVHTYSGFKDILLRVSDRLIGMQGGMAVPSTFPELGH